MVTDNERLRELHNETAANVAGLLKAQTGATREYRIHLDEFFIDGDTVARDINGDVRLTRLRDSIIANVQATGVASLMCARCLREYDQPFVVDFDEAYEQTVDVRTGLDLGRDFPEDEQTSRVDENHELDLREPLRQEILVALPMRPDCGPDCPGPDVTEVGDDEAVDDRFAALANLLGDDQGNEPVGRS
jgi:uncharacterized protein